MVEDMDGYEDSEVVGDAAVAVEVVLRDCLVAGPDSIHLWQVGDSHSVLAPWEKDDALPLLRASGLRFGSGKS